MEQSRRKEIIAAYKQQPVTGGVYAVTCAATGRVWIKGDLDLRGAKNRFDFAAATDSALTPSMRDDWKRHGASAFTFAVLEELEKKEEVALSEFRRDLATLEELWREKYAPDTLY